MKTAVLAALEHTRIDLLHAIAAIERDDVGEALVKLESVASRLRLAAEEIRA